MGRGLKGIQGRILNLVQRVDLLVRDFNFEVRPVRRKHSSPLRCKMLGEGAKFLSGTAGQGHDDPPGLNFTPPP